mmetsp:Transcript_8748/g.22927  ORF Transcript_8748/g.22927 Transcript_8748/m.22927 type:complete len:271 (+) Transcript_8748:182-994(+)
MDDVCEEQPLVAHEQRKRRLDAEAVVVYVDDLESQLVSPPGKKARWTSPLSEIIPVVRPAEELLQRSASEESCGVAVVFDEQEETAGDVSEGDFADEEEKRLAEPLFLTPDMGNGALVACVARYLQRTLDRSEPAAPVRIGSSDPISVFFSAERQKFNLEPYVKRVVGLVNGSSSIFFAALCYMKRIANSDSRLTANAYNVHRLWITAVVLASKTLEDEVYSNEHYARMGGVPSLAEMNRLEACMLDKLGFRMHISPEEYASMRISVLAI